MSLIPFILDLADELQEIKCSVGLGNASSIDTDDFGFGIYPHELQLHPQQQQQHQLRQPTQPEMRRSRPLSQLYWLPKQRHHPYYRSSRIKAAGAQPAASVDAERELREAISNTHAGKSAYSVVNKHGFQVSMNVKQFAPDELTVKTIDNCIVVEGRHDEKEDGHGVISRHFIRKYMLPRAYDPSDVLSTLSSDGILTVKAPLPPATKADATVERSIMIQQIGPGPAQHLAGRETAARELATTLSSPKEQQQPPAQMQLQKMQKEQSELQKVSERNGDDDTEAKKLETEIETEPAKSAETAELATGEVTMLTSSVADSMAPPITVDVIVDAGIAAAAAVDEEKAKAAMDLDVAISAGACADAGGKVSACTNNDKETNKENGRVADITIPVVIPDIVIADMETIDAAAVSAMNVDDDGDATIVAIAETETFDADVNANAKDAVVDNLTAVAQLPTAGDLVAAADAAILLAKAQCENGTAAKTPAEEVAN